MIAGLCFFVGCFAFSVGFLGGAWWGSKTGLESESDWEDQTDVDE